MNVRSLRKFTTDGLMAFDDGLAQLAGGLPFDVGSLLERDDLSEVVEGEQILAEPEFSCRFEMAGYLTPLVMGCALPNALEDRGLWSWIAAAWLEPLLGDAATSRLGHPQRWLLRTNAWQSYYRHLFAGPCAIVAQHQDNPDRCRVMLTTTLLQPGSFYDDAASQQRTVRSKGVIEAMAAIYLNEDGDLRPGAAGSASGGGSIRRFTRHLDRLELTYDLQSITAAALLDEEQAILPEEFRHFVGG